jgi:hypothetical protein
MKIIYNKNPLFTTVELDENEKKELWYKIKIIEMEDLLSEAALALEEGTHFDLKRARKAVEMNYYWPENGKKSGLDKRVDQLFEYIIQALKSYHMGDCTCVACSCPKCYAESILGIDTIQGLGKHEAYKIYNAFGKYNEKTIDEAIATLSNFEINQENYNPEAWEKFGGYEKYVSCCKTEQERAHNWLINYKNEYFKS